MARGLDMGGARDHRIVIIEEGATAGLSSRGCIGTLVGVTITASTALALYGR